MTRPIRQHDPSLFDAIRSRSLSEVRTAIEAQGDLAVKARDGRGWTPLMAAAAEGHAGIARLVLRAAFRAVQVGGLREVVTGPDGLDALKIAAEHGHRPTFTLLAAWLPEDGFIPKYPKAYSAPGHDFGDGATIDRLVAAAADGRVDEVEFCLARGVEVDGYDTKSRQAMHEAVRRGHTDVVRALVAAGADPDERTNLSTTLALAAEAGRPAVIRALIDGGADIHDVQAIRENALMKAAEKGYLDTAQTLIELGIDVNARDRKARSALGRAIENRDAPMIALLKSAGGVEPDEAAKHLHAAVIAGDLAGVRALIEQDVNLTVKGRIDRTALEEAVEEKHGEVVDALLEAGALRLETDEGAGNLITRAAYWRQPRIVQSLLKAGADPDGDDQYGTALAQAAENGDREIVRILLGAGADPNKDPGGGSALTFALRGGDPEIIALLREHGAQKSYGGQRVEDLRGAGSFDVNDLWLLVRAPVEDAARAFAESRGGGAAWDRDVFGRTVAVSPLCYLAFRFRGHSWTLITDLHSEDWYGPVNESDAEEVSRRLGVRAIDYGISDTANAIGYALYESGELLERMAFGEGGESEDVAAQSDTTFTSRLRTLSAEELDSPFELADAFLREQGAFAPAFGSLLGLFAKLAGKISFGVGGMEAEDFERVDVIHLPKGAISLRMKELRGPMEEPDPDWAQFQGADGEDVPF